MALFNHTSLPAGRQVLKNNQITQAMFLFFSIVSSKNELFLTQKTKRSTSSKELIKIY